MGPSVTRFFAGLVVVYGSLFGAGGLLLGRVGPGLAGLAAALLAAFVAVRRVGSQRTTAARRSSRLARRLRFAKPERSSPK